MIEADGCPAPISRCAACRTRSSALLTLSRLWVRSVSRCLRFPLARPLPSSASAPSSPGLFVAFFGTMSLSDFPCPSIIGVRLSTSRCVPPHHLWRAARGSPRFCTRCFHACSGSSTPQGPCPSRDTDGPDVAFRLPRGRRHPRRGRFRSSIPGLHAPLSTLRPLPYGRRRMTRGQGGSLFLPCARLSLATPRQLTGAFRGLAPRRGRRGRPRAPPHPTTGGGRAPALRTKGSQS